MAYRSSSPGALAGTGGGRLPPSDTRIAADVAGLPQLPAPGFRGMLTYVAARYLPTGGALRAMYGERRTTS
ncbi:hypothetical protein ACFY8W_16790 [Streptomyces sp. NPDC012637]|uniref:hypothetical protein n=1 Tax=Streptomyces sp. NPDC012637 TaxID=3364842 RepID=UPI0036E27C24